LEPTAFCRSLANDFQAVLAHMRVIARKSRLWLPESVSARDQLFLLSVE
jgi:hypothetical protein